MPPIRESLVSLIGVGFLLAALVNSPATASESEFGPAPARNPLRETGRVVSADLTLLQQLRTDASGKDQRRALLAIYRLREFGTAGAVTLSQLLARPDQPMEIRFSAENTLATMGTDAVTPLVTILQANPAADHSSIWRTLSRLGPEARGAIPIAVSILRNPDADDGTRASAANLLGQIGLTAQIAIDPLLEVIEQEGSDELRGTCLEALQHVGELRPHQQSRLVNLLLNEEAEPRLRVNTATILAGQPTPPEVLLPVLIGLTQNAEDLNGCIEATRAIAKLGTRAEDAVPRLVQLLEHEAIDVQLAAIAACSAIGADAQQAIPALLERIQPASGEGVAEAAAAALIRIHPQTVESMVLRLRGDESNCEPTLRALAAIGPAAQPAIPDLLRMLADSSHADQHLAIIQLLGNLGSEAAAAIPPLQSVVTDDRQQLETRSAAALTLGRISPDSASILLVTLRDREPALRIAAAHALALQNLRQRTAIPALIHELGDTDAAESAMQALVAIGSDAQTALETIIFDQDAPYDQRERACRVLGKMGSSSLPSLLRILQSDNEGLANVAAVALWDFDSQTAIPAILEAIRIREIAATTRRRTDLNESQLDADPVIERLLKLVTELSGPRGGGTLIGSGSGSYSAREFRVGSAATPRSAPTMAEPSSAAPMAMPMDEAPAAEAPGAAAPETASESSAPDAAVGSPIQPTQGVKARGAMEAPANPKMKMVKVFYGTNRKPLETPVQHWSFLQGGFWPAIFMGGATVLVCLIGLAQTRSKLTVALAVVGAIATVCLTYPATQQASNSARTLIQRPGPVYGSDPNDLLSLGTCEVSIPPDHQSGEMESPSILRLEFKQDPEKHVTLREVVPLNNSRFHAEMQRGLAEKGNNILVFVHGYNVDFDTAARRTAQLACDLEFAGVPLFFSWPSQGNWYEYRQDEKQVELAVPLLKKFLTDVAGRAKASSIHLIAHSMGNRALTTALKEMATESAATSTKFNQVVLAAPDIDADIFRDRIAPAIVGRAQRVTLYASSNDLALLASRTFNSGDLRAGDTSCGLIVTRGIETIDVSAVDTSLLGHSYYGDSPTILTDLKELLQSAVSADKRPFLQAKGADPLRYWIFEHPTLAERPSHNPGIR